MSRSVKPVFLFSLPRSGSTLLQRLLASNSQISSTAEPWILLPLLSLVNKESGLAYYSNRISSEAIEDFSSHLPLGRRDFDDALRLFVSDLYSRYCQNDEIFFLDKTPRYYFIIPEIVSLYPDAKFIFLVRPPHQVLASIIDTWGNGRFHRFDSNMIDIYRGIPLLAEGRRLLAGRSIVVNYSDLLSNPSLSLSRIADYLGLEDVFPALHNLKGKQILGRMGDPSGVKDYNEVSRAPLEKWKNVFATRLRKKIVMRIFSQIDARDISEHGIEKNDLLKQIGELPEHRMGWCRDLVDYSYACFRYWRSSNRYCSSRPGYFKDRTLS